MNHEAKKIICMAIMVIFLVLTGCKNMYTLEREDAFANVRQNGLASLEDSIYAMLDNNGNIELHSFDRETGERSVVELSAVEKENEFFVGLDLNNYYLKSNGRMLFSTGFGGSGGIYRIDPQKSSFERIGFYQEAVLRDWTHDEETAYLAMYDRVGYGLYAMDHDEMEMHGKLPKPLLYREGNGEIGAIWVEDGNLLFFERRHNQSWFDLVRFELMNGNEYVIASDLCSDMAPRIDDTYMVIRYAGQEEGYEFYRAEVLLLNKSGEQIAKIMDVDGLWRATAAGGKFVLDRMFAENIEGEHEVYVIDPKNLDNINCALLGENYNVVIGGDRKYAYFWSDRQNVNSASELMALDMETMEVVSPFVQQK